MMKTCNHNAIKDNNDFYLIMMRNHDGNSNSENHDDKSNKE